MRHFWIMTLGVMLFAAEADSMENWVGLYRKPDGTIIGINNFHEFGESNILVNYSDGRVGALFELPDGRIGISSAIGSKSPPPIHTLARKGSDLILDGDTCHKVEITRQPFVARHGSVNLAGELLRPTGKVKGVLLFIHGSGDGPRQAYDVWSHLFCSQGWAVLIYDKRGSGSSTGDWHESDFVTLADDARFVLRWARSQEELHDLKLGLWGVSQAGWIIPQVAAEGSVDFAIMQAGAIVPVDEFVQQTLESELRAYGFPPEEIAKAQEYYALDYAVSRGLQPYEVIEAAYSKAAAAGAEWLLEPPDKPGSPQRKFMGKIAGFDAADYWRKVNVPLLVLFGGKDHVVPAGPNQSRLQALLSNSEKKRAEIVVLPDDNHLNMIAKTGVRAEYAGLDRFDPRYFETLTRFLRRLEKE